MFDIGHFQIQNKNQTVNKQQLNNGIPIVKPDINYLNGQTH
jgi:hypothetical protein